MTKGKSEDLIGDGEPSHDRAKPGNNSGVDHLDSKATDALKTFIDRIERLQSEQDELKADIKDVFTEAKGQGFDTKAIREILKRRKEDVSERQEKEAVLELYMTALGMM